MSSITSLRLVAALFILAGASSAWGMIGSVFYGAASVSTGVLGLFIGIGLLRHSARWRAAVLIAIWLALAVGFTGCIVVLSMGDIPVKVFGETIAGTTGRPLAVAVTPQFKATYFWMYRVLVRADVKAIFENARPTMHSNNDATKDGARFSSFVEWQ